jgi:hypothetical protein
MAPDADESGFLSRWSRRKALVRQGVALEEPVPAPPADPSAPPARPLAKPAASAAPAVALHTTDLTSHEAPTAEPAPAPPGPTLADAALLTRDSDYTRFVARGVQPEVKNAALAKLFTDPHFNVMDGLDTYIDDYGKPDPLPPGMLRQMLQAHVLGLFDEEDAAAAKAAAARSAEPGAEASAGPSTDPTANPAVDPTADPSDHAIAPTACSEAPLLPPDTATDEDTDLQLQPDHGAGCAGPAAGAGENAGQPH